MIWHFERLSMFEMEQHFATICTNQTSHEQAVCAPKQRQDCSVSSKKHANVHACKKQAQLLAKFQQQAINCVKPNKTIFLCFDHSKMGFKATCTFFISNQSGIEVQDLPNILQKLSDDVQAKHLNPFCTLAGETEKT